MVSNQDIDRILNSDLTKELVYELAASLGDKPPKYKEGLREPVILEPGVFFGHNKTKIETTLGRLIFNKLIIEPVSHFTGFINYPFTKKAYGKLNKKLSNAYKEDKINQESFIKFCEGVDKSMGFYSVFCSSNSKAVMKELPKTMKRKWELYEEHKEAIEAGDPLIGAQIEKELIEIAKEEVGDDPALDIYRSGAKGSFENNFKNMNIMIGPIFDPNSPTGYKIIMSSYAEGFKKSDIPAQANLIVDGAYAKGITTQVGGKMTKDWYAKYQSEMLGPEDSDCGTKHTKTIKLTRKNIDDYEYNYIMENGKPVLLDLDTMDKYIGKTVEMRVPENCQQIKYCGICGGKFYRIMEYTNVGLTLVRITSDIMNSSLKKFHDVSVKVYDLNTDNLSL